MENMHHAMHSAPDEILLSEQSENSAVVLVNVGDLLHRPHRVDIIVAV